MRSESNDLSRGTQALRASIGCASLFGAATLAVGLVFDSLPALRHWQLFVAFHAASLCGLLIGVRSVWRSVPRGWPRTLVVLLGWVVWRVAYFPIFVLAGWMATGSDWLFFAISTRSSVVYPVFFFAMLGLHGLAVAATVMLVWRCTWAAMTVAVPLFILALLVSFNQADDFSLLPDRTIVRPGTPPPAIRAQGNVYIELLRYEHYNFAQRTLLYAGRVLYTLIPPAPWSTSVRDTIAQGLRAKPIGSSADRIYEHYIAYVVAQPCISRSPKCPGV